MSHATALITKGRSGTFNAETLATSGRIVEEDSAPQVPSKQGPIHPFTKGGGPRIISPPL